MINLARGQPNPHKKKPAKYAKPKVNVIAKVRVAKSAACKSQIWPPKGNVRNATQTDVRLNSNNNKKGQKKDGGPIRGHQQSH